MNNDIKSLSLSEYCLGSIRKLMNQHADHLATGSCKNFEEYKRIAGIIEGLALAEREVLDWLEQHTQ